MSGAVGWWLAADGRVFGPYAREQLAGFRLQGRFAATSLMARKSEGPFTAAADWPELAALFPAPDAPASRPSPAGERSIIVLAALRDTSPDMLEAALLTFGPAVRLRGTLWACRARLPAAGLRNAVSRKLAAGEFLFVAELDAADAAWFNLDGEADRALRRLWAKASG